MSPDKQHAHSARKAELRQELAQLFVEAVYLGLTEEDVAAIYRHAQGTKERSDNL
ncbi:hypothetical protein D3C76_1704620 [compost metagenome]